MFGNNFLIDYSKYTGRDDGDFRRLDDTTFARRNEELALEQTREETMVLLADIRHEHGVRDENVGTVVDADYKQRKVMDKNGLGSHTVELLLGLHVDSGRQRIRQ